MKTVPNAKGYFDGYGGIYVPETLMSALAELTEAYESAKKDPQFEQELNDLLKNFVGRPTPLYLAKNLTSQYGGPKIYLKREDLGHTGAHKINNTVGQILLTKRMGKKRVIAETGAGQHGVATAAAAALYGLECEVYMGEEDMARQAPNVTRMELMGAKVTPVSAGSKTLKDAINEAMRDWVTNVETTHYVLGSVLGPHPYPMMIRDFQKVIGKEARKQILQVEGKLPAALIACVGGGSNAIGLFHPFLKDAEVKLFGVEAGGRGNQLGEHAARFDGGRPGVLHGCYTYVLQDEDGQVARTHSASAGLDYPAVGPEHAYLKELNRVTYTHVTDEEALNAFQELNRIEGILPALESAHAIAYLKKIASQFQSTDSVILNLSGRGDKDVDEVTKLIS